MTELKSGKLNNEPHCPCCSQILNGWTVLEGEGLPKEGDVTVCLYCSSVLQFSADLELEYAPVEVIAELTLEISRAQNLARDINESL